MCRRRNRSGFSIPELLITFVIAGVVTSLAMTPLSRMRNSMGVRAALQETVATLEAARASATQHGHTARLVVRGNAVLAVADTAPAGGPVAGTFTVRAPQRFDQAYGVTLSLAYPSDTVVAYDARGFANPRPGHIVRIVATKGTAKDSLCISNLGQLLRSGCTP